MSHPIRNRIKAHRRIRAGDLIPHEWNFRLHPESQQAALQAFYEEVGFARSLLVYERVAPSSRNHHRSETCPALRKVPSRSAKSEILQVCS